MFLTNHLISNLVCKINNGTLRHVRFIELNYSDRILELLKILYNNGVIRSYNVVNNSIVRVYLKYYLSNRAIKLSVISTPGNRIYWKVGKLLTKYSKDNFSGFYIITTQTGVYTSDYCLNLGIKSGEILLKVEI